jgi:hypothetical protein
MNEEEEPTGRTLEIAGTPDAYRSDHRHGIPLEGLRWLRAGTAHAGASWPARGPRTLLDPSPLVAE